MPPLTKNRDNFLRSGPFLMSNSGNESHGHACSYAFGFVKKYSFVQKLQPKTFCGLFSTTRFSENIFEKSKNSIFRFFLSKNVSSKFPMKIFRSKNYFSKNRNFWFFKNIFSLVRYEQLNANDSVVFKLNLSKLCT